MLATCIWCGRKYTYDRNGNRLSKEDLTRKALSEAYTYDKLNRLTDTDKGVMVSGTVTSSDPSLGYNMDLLGNLNATGGLAVHGVSEAVKHNANATNEIRRENRSGPVLDEVQLGAGARCYLQSGFHRADWSPGHFGGQSLLSMGSMKSPNL